MLSLHIGGPAPDLNRFLHFTRPGDLPARIRTRTVRASGPAENERPKAQAEPPHADAMPERLRADRVDPSDEHAEGAAL